MIWEKNHYNLIALFLIIILDIYTNRYFDNNFVALNYMWCDGHTNKTNSKYTDTYIVWFVDIGVAK